MFRALAQESKAEKKEEKKPEIHSLGSLPSALIAEPKNIVFSSDGQVIMYAPDSDMFVIFDPKNHHQLERVTVGSKNFQVYPLQHNQLFIYKGVEGQNNFFYDINRHKKVTSIFSDGVYAGFWMPLPDDSFISVSGFNESKERNLNHLIKGSYNKISFKNEHTVQVLHSISNRFAICLVADKNILLIYDLVHKKYLGESRFRSAPIEADKVKFAPLAKERFALRYTDEKNITVFGLDDKLELVEHFVFQTKRENPYVIMGYVPESDFLIYYDDKKIHLCDIEKKKQIDAIDYDHQKLGGLRYMAVRPSDGVIFYVSENMQMGYVTFPAIEAHYENYLVPKRLVEAFIDRHHHRKRKKNYVTPSIVELCCEYAGASVTQAGLFRDQYKRETDKDHDHKSACVIS